MKKLDRQILKEIHLDLNKALVEIAKKRGLDSLTIGAISYSEDKFTARLTGISSKETLVNKVGGGDLFKKSFTNLGKRYTIVDVKLNSPKFPIIAVDENGKRYKFPMTVSSLVK
jgi:hypothetical protein